MKPAFPYKRLPGGERGFVRKSSLWEGADHLLLVRGTRFNEEYRRFNYRDIQVVSSVRCARAGSTGWWLLNIFVFFIALLFSLTPANHAHPYLVGMPLLLGAGVIARAIIALRYSCRCVLQTAVSREELVPLQRVWHATKALRIVRQRIVEEQGELPLDFGTLLPETGTKSVFRNRNDRNPSGVVDGKLKGYATRATAFAIVLFVLMLVNAGLSARFLDGPTATRMSATSRVLESTLVLSMGAATLFSLFSSHRLPNQSAMRKLLVTALLLQGFDVYLSTIMGSFYTLRQQTVVINVPTLQAWRWLIRFDVCAFLLVGAGGLVFLLLNWDFLRRGEASQT